MITKNTLENRLIEKVKNLSVEQIQQVEQFIDSLGQEKQLTLASTTFSESVFSKIWDNPEDADYDNL